MTDTAIEKSSSQTFKDTCALAAGMLRQDGLKLLLLYPLICIPGVLESTQNALSPKMSLVLSILERFTGLLFCFIVTRSWCRRLAKDRPRLGHSAGSFAELLLCGLVIWVMFAVPLLAQFAAPNPTTKLFFSLLLIPAIALSIRYYFYFFFTSIGMRPIFKALTAASSINRGGAGLVVMTLCAPLGIMLTSTALVLAISPDGRSPGIEFGANLLVGIFWLLSSYLATATVFDRLPQTIWDELELDPYRNARLTTLKVQAPPWLSYLLRPRTGATLLFVSAFLWWGNTIKVATLPPTPKISVQHISIDDDRVSLTITLADPDYHFRGFNPHHFLLAGKNRELISGPPERIFPVGADPEGPLRIDKNVTTLNLIVEFIASRSGAELAELEDLHLWYRHSQLMRLDLKTAEIKAPSPPDSPAEAQP
ncbi:MAG: hypothetical protein K1X83_15155 [Oligoflexia bacterium]|nr:hypothetical protein [Oligoflexia bacterium]